MQRARAPITPRQGSPHRETIHRLTKVCGKPEAEPCAVKHKIFTLNIVIPHAPRSANLSNTPFSCQSSANKSIALATPARTIKTEKINKISHSTNLIEICTAVGCNQGIKAKLIIIASLLGISITIEKTINNLEPL